MRPIVRGVGLSLYHFHNRVPPEEKKEHGIVLYVCPTFVQQEEVCGRGTGTFPSVQPVAPHATARQGRIGGNIFLLFFFILIANESAASVSAAQAVLPRVWH